MRKLLIFFSNTLLFSVLILSQGTVFAQDATFSEAEIDQMMAPIALYPDSLLSQILMACTYPADITEAIKWSKNNPDQQGDAAVKAVQDKSWDPSVMSLVAFPQVLSMMEKQPSWVENVGDAFLADSNAVMDSVQKLRKKAKDEGNLETTRQQKVIVKEQPSETIVIIEPANPQVVYVPIYNPTVVYGTWWWPYYRPWYYYPPGYVYGTALIRGISFGIGIGITHALWGNCHWGRGYNSININVNKYNNINVNRNKLNVNKANVNWNHNANNRRGVPYRDNKTRQQFENKRPGAEQRMDFRGRDAQREKARATLNNRAINPAEGRKQLQGSSGNRARASIEQANRDISRGQLDRAQTRNTQQTRNMNTMRETKQSRDVSSHSTRNRDNAFNGASRPQQARQSINRGNTSARSMNSGGGFNRSAGNRSGGGRRR